MPYQYTHFSEERFKPAIEHNSHGTLSELIICWMYQSIFQLSVIWLISTPLYKI